MATYADERLPYPPSALMDGFSIEPERVSIGDGDNWAITWGDDDKQYSFFTDGMGFGAHKKDVSISPVVIEGDPPKISGVDIESVSGTVGYNKGGPSSAKVCGLVMIKGVLYAWVRNVNPPGMPKGTGSQLMVSEDYAKTWKSVDWIWPDIGYPTWLNAGKNYGDAQDGFAYFISTDGPSAYYDYDSMIMARVPVDEILIKEKYAFFAGKDENGNAKWGTFKDRKPFFENAEGSFRPGIVYNVGLKKYFLSTAIPKEKWRWWWGKENPGRRQHLGIFESDNPWGPWKTVFYERDWRAPENVFAPQIPAKWISEDGRSFYLQYSCIPKGPYKFNIQKCTIRSSIK